MEKIQTNELSGLLKDCRHPHPQTSVLDCEKVSSEDSYAKRKFERFIQEYNANFQRRWQTEIVP